MWFLRRRQNKAGLEEATDAIHVAKRSLRDVQSRETEVSKVSQALRELRERNHFAENLEAIMIRHGGPAK